MDKEFLAGIVRDSNIDAQFRSILSGQATQDKLQAVLLAYDRALSDPNVTLPSYLHAVLEAARK